MKKAKIILGILALLLVAGAGVTGTLFFRWKGDRDDAKNLKESVVGKDAATHEITKPTVSDPDPSKVNIPEETTTEAVTEEPLSASYNGFEVGDQKIQVYSWNTELGERLNYFYDKYPELKGLVEYNNLGLGGTSDDYKIALENAVSLGGDAYPSIICMDNDVALYFLDSDWCMDMDELGLSGYARSTCYDYTLEFATVNGSLKALSWQACPGSFIYRNDIAEAVFGTSDPAAIQSYISDWDKFLEAAGTLKAAGYKILSGPDDVKFAFMDSRTSPWVVDDRLIIDPSVNAYLEMSKALYDGDYTNRTSMWSDDWQQNFNSNVFGYFGCTWFLYWCVPPNSAFYGNCSMCQGPVAYHWGGSYLAVMKDCPNKGLAALVLYTLCCDTEVMEQLSLETLDFVNNKDAIRNIIDSGQGGSDVLAGYNPLTVWDEAARNISLDVATPYDSTINSFLDIAASEYDSGGYNSVDDAITGLKGDVMAIYPYLDTE